MNRLYFYRSLITRIRQYLISKSGTNPVTLTNAVEDKLLQGFSITGNSQQSGTPSVESPSPIQTTELKKSSNLLHTDYFNEAKTANGVTFQYLADEDCFLLNGTSTAAGSIASPYSIQNANNQPFTISAFYVSGNVTVPTNSDIVAYIGGSNDNFYTNNFNYTELRQNNTSRTKICNYPYITMFWFYFTTGVVLENYKVKISVTKLENSFDISKVENHSSVTNTGDSLVITPTGTNSTSNSGQPLYTMCHGLNVGDKIIVNMTATTDGGVYNAFSSPKTRVYLSTYGNRVLESGTVYTLTADDLLGRPQWYSSFFYDKEYTENKSTITNISISKIPTNYDPYGKYGLEIKQEKNILDLSKAHNGQFMTVTERSENKVVATANNTTNNSPVLDLFKQLIPAGNYVLSYTVNIENTPQLQSGAGDRRNEMLIFVGGTFKAKTSSIFQDGIYTQNIKFTSQSASMVRIAWYRNVVNNVVTEDTTYKVTFTNVQLEQGTEASTYTPYQTPQYNRIWIDKPTLNKNDILTKDKLYVHSKKYLLSDIFGTPVDNYITETNDTWTGDVNFHYQDKPPFNTYVANFSGFCNIMDVYVNTYEATNSFINIYTPAEGYPVVFMDLTLKNPSATWAKPSDFQSFLLTSGSYLMLYYSGNAEDSFEQSNVSYIDLKPLSAGNNTLTVTNEISPTGCYYKYYSDKEN